MMISYVAICPHPPLIIPEVGGENISKVKDTVEAMQDLAKKIVDSKPDTVVFLTPHGNVFSDCLSCLSEDSLEGDLKSFGSPEVKTAHNNDLNLLSVLQSLAAEQGIHLLGIDKELAEQHGLKAELDHGIMVPLYYLEKAGLKDKSIAAISIGYLDRLELYNFGSLIRKSAEKSGKRIAIVGSGDMSHRLKDEGPYDYHPDGSIFDEKISKLLAASDVRGILDLAVKLVDNAGECGYRSILIALGVLDGMSFSTKVFSYEGPFGVGYLTAAMTVDGQSESILSRMQTERADQIKQIRAEESVQVKWARLNLESKILNVAAPDLPVGLEDYLGKKSAAFVSIKKNGQLRGCIGTFLPAYSNLAEEIKHNALAAGLRDPRFSPIEAVELDGLIYSVDILEEPESCNKEELDPAKYGVIVSSDMRRGLLLPDLEGVDTVEEQLAIALQKAGISPRETYEIERFEVKRYT